MQGRTALIGFVGVLLAATISFVAVTNEDRVADADGTDGGARVVAAPAASPDVSTQEAAAGLAPANNHSHESSNPDHAAELQPDKPLDDPTRDQLASELVGAREVALRYPTVADAEAAGYRRAGEFAPLVGAHYVSYSGLSGNGPIDVTKPNSLIYDGISPTSRIVGLMYYAMSGDEQPEGFAGPNDHWHRHRGVCIKNTATGIDVPFPADADVTQRQCGEVGGNFMDITGWMVHAWVVPGWESRAGVFSHDNPSLHCADGTDETDDAGFCQGT